MKTQLLYQQCILPSRLWTSCRWLLLAMCWPGLALASPQKTTPTKSLTHNAQTLHHSALQHASHRWTAARKRRKRKRRKLPDKPIDLNTASVKELILLPRIGRSKAKKIIALRKSLGGRFSSIDQLVKIRGIGKKTVAKLRPYLTLGGASSTTTTTTTDADNGGDDPPPQMVRRKRRKRRGKRKRRKRRKKRARRKRRKKRARRGRRGRSKRKSWRRAKRSGGLGSRGSYEDYDNPPMDPYLDPPPQRDSQPPARSNGQSAPQSGTTGNRGQTPQRRNSEDTSPIVPQPARRPAARPVRVARGTTRIRRRRRKGKRRSGKRRNCYQRWRDRYGDRFQPINVNVAPIKKLRTLPCIGKKRALAIVAVRGSIGPYLKLNDLRKVTGIGKKILGWLAPLVRFKLDVNRATLSQLEALRPLSGGLGEAIIKYRKRRGRFRKLRHLLRVKGLGRGDFAKLKNLLTIETPRAASQQPKVIKID